MDKTPVPLVRPRTEGAPEVDLTSFAIIHRAMCGEVRRLADLTAAQGDTPFPPERETALRRLLGHLATEIHGHHTKEDEVLWPVVSASAGAAVDLLPLTEDHTAIDPCLDRLRTATGRERAEALAVLRDLMEEHIAEEEAVLFPVMRRYVSVADFTACEKRFQRGAPLSHMRFVLPFIADHATPEELARMMKTAGPVMGLLVRLFRPGYDRLRRTVYGS
ncbi:hemerythrin domain-containing protein [Actinocorallia libanotica]|uniref:Hemerythrin domain-containing protein n=1 Tax=Actinocorallia libanotica TaxID=46162 RepID=A0ABN1RYX3_9ACTN